MTQTPASGDPSAFITLPEIKSAAASAVGTPAINKAESKNVTIGPSPTLVFYEIGYGLRNWRDSYSSG
jgi:hypothetical protein